MSDLRKFRASHRHLIVDDTTYPIIEKLFSDDVLNYVYTCKKIDGERSKNRDSALYLLDPTRNYSISCLSADFSKGQRYKDTVVMFLPGPWNLFWDDLLQNEKFKQSLVIQSTPHIAEYLSFVPLEPRLFVTGNYHSIPVYYRSDRHGTNYLTYQMDMAVNSMTGLCILTNEYPTIRYYNSPLSKSLAVKFQRRLDEYYREHPDIIPLNSKTIFLITDRTMDMFGPVCHYQFYRSQIFDLMDEVEIERDVDPKAKYAYTVQTGSGATRKTLNFNEHDEIFMELKDLSIENATSRLRTLYSELKKEDAKFSGKSLETANGLRHALVNKDIHAERKALITGHYLLCEKMWKNIEKEHLGDIITFENLCAAGLGPIDRAKVPVTDGLLHLLSNQEINIYNKIRLLISYAIYRHGLIKSDLRKLLMFSMPEKVENVLKLFENLQSIGVIVLKQNLEKPACIKNTYFGIEDTDNQMQLFKPTYSNIISRMVYNQLPEYYNTMTLDTSGYMEDEDESLKTFPFVKAAPSMSESDSFATTRNQPKWKSTKNTNDASRQKVILFCAGGLTPSELSSITSLEDELNRNIIIGTDEVYTVWDMLGDVTLINETEFEFPLQQKLAKKPVPQFIIDDSMDPSLVKQANQSAPGSAPAATTQIHKHQLSTSSSTSEPQANKHHHKLKFGLPGHKKSESDDASESGLSDKKKVKGMMKKFKKFSI